jgi:hypothetical protein
VTYRSDRHEQWAIFWCSLLEPLICGEIPPEEAGDFLRKVTKRECLFPNGRRGRPSRAALWRKWKLYREGGFEGLLRKRRSDRGQPRKVKPAVIDRAVALKKDQPRRSDKAINRFLKHEFKLQLPKSTLYRHLRKAGATRLKLGVSQQKVRRRWTRDQSNALLVGDFEDGPYVLDGDCVRETHLSVWIDCHSRYVVEGRYYYRENLAKRTPKDEACAELVFFTRCAGPWHVEDSRRNPLSVEFRKLLDKIDAEAVKAAKAHAKETRTKYKPPAKLRRPGLSCTRSRPLRMNWATTSPRGGSWAMRTAASATTTASGSATSGYGA